MPNRLIHGVDVFYRAEGQGRTVLLGHSSTGSSGQWRGLIDGLSNRYRFLAPDHIGYGRTGADPGAADLMALEVDILESLLENSADPVHLIGHSYGGSLVARLAVRAPERVRSLSMIEPTLFHLLGSAGKDEAFSEIRGVAERVSHFVDHGDPVEAARGFIAYWIGAGAFDAMEPRVRDTIVAGMGKLRAEWSYALMGPAEDVETFERLQCPIQLIRGTDTTRAAGTVVDLLRELWPTAEYGQIDDAGHMCPVTHPDQVNALLEAFLDRHN